MQNASWIFIARLLLVALCSSALSSCDRREQTANLSGRVALIPADAVLPPGSQLTVFLEELGSDGVAGSIIAETQQSAQGTQLFDLHYYPKTLTSNRNYQLRAHIVAATGKVLWTTDAVPMPRDGKTPTLTARPLLQMQTRFYRCNDLGVKMETKGEQAILMLQDQTYHLQQVHSGAGLHFQSSELQFWVKAGEATLTLAGGTRMQCVQQQQVNPWTKAA